MADLVPDCTELFPAANTPAGILAALYTHWNGGGRFSIDDANTTTNTGDEGITISPDAAAETWQANLRNNGGNIIEASVEPAGTITDAGDSTPTAPTGTTADWSTESTWDVTENGAGAGSRYWLIETDDHFTFLVTNTADAYDANGAHIGRCYFPTNGANMEAIGQDGLVCATGRPDEPTAGAGSTDWFASKNDNWVHYETNLWGTAGGLGTLGTLSAPDGTDGETHTIPIAWPATSDIGGQKPVVGVLKYIRAVGLSSAPRTVKPVPGSNQGWRHMNDSVAITPQVIIWNKTVTA